MKGEGMSVTKFAQNGLVRLGYEMNGQGEPAVLILHGALQGRVTMRPLADALAERTTTIAMDLRGHGGSSAVHGLDMQVRNLVDDAFAVLDAAEIDSGVVVVGVELGAIVASHMQAAHPDRIRDAVLINYPSGEMLDTDTLNAIADMAYKGQAELALNRWLDLSWGTGWQDSTSRARIAAARRSVEAIHPMLTALARAEVAASESIQLPGGMPFDDEEDLATTLAAIGRIIGWG